MAFKWPVEEQHSDKAHAVLQSWESQDVRVTAPPLMPVEVSNALHQRVVRGEISVEVAVDLIVSLLSSRLELHQTPHLHVRALQLASQLKQNAAYDAHYWRWRRASAASCGPPMRGSTGRQAKALTTYAG